MSDATPNTDEVYYSGTGGLAAKAAYLARRRIYELFLREMQPTAATTLLDVGVSDVETAESNIVEKLYPHKAQITAAGIGSAPAFSAHHPLTRFVPIAPGAPLPFKDGEFDIAMSNAVLEHVGGKAERKAFISELLRVSKRLFLTIPHRWFPVEHHTAIPLAHYAPPVFRAVCRATGRDFWADPAHLEFLGKAQLRSEWPGPRRLRIVSTGLPLGPWASNLAMIA